MRRILALSTLTLLCGAAGAQVVHPAVFKDKVGTTYTYYLFRNSTTPDYRKCRYMQVHDLNPSSALKIKGLAFRMASYYTYNTQYKYLPFKAQLELSLSTAKTTASTASSTFAANVGADAVTVVSKKFVDFPGHAGHAFPNPFEYKLPFDTGKVFTLAAGKSLCWDLKAYDNDLHPSKGYSIYLDTGNISTYPYGTYFGRGSQIPGGHPYIAHYGNMYVYYSATTGYKFYGSCYYGPGFGKTFFFLSTGKGNGSLVGPYARLWIDPAKIVGFFGPYDLNYSGYFYKSSSSPFFKIPFRPWKLGLHLYSQWFSLDKALNLYSTNGYFTQLNLWKSSSGVNLGVARIYRYGSTAFTSTTGYLAKNYGVVTLFY